MCTRSMPRLRDVRNCAHLTCHICDPGKENAEAEKQRVEVIHPDEMTQDIMDHLRDGGVEGLLENL